MKNHEESMKRKVTRAGTVLFDGTIYEHTDLFSYCGEIVLIEKQGEKIAVRSEQNEFICLAEKLVWK
jgi:hypothetical protein